MASASSSQQTLPSPSILLFARGVVAILDLWPALTIAVAEQWGGPESADKKVWIASTIIDEWEQRTSYLPAAPSSEPTPLQVDPADAKDPALDLDDLADLLNQMMTDEFDANLEDGSIDAVASDIIKLWHDILIPPSAEITPELLVGAFEQKAAAQRKKGIQASRGADPEEGDDLDDDASGSGSDDEDEGDMDVDEAPQLVAREPKEKEEPVVDEDGFTLVQSKGRKGR
ncbi:putative 20S pre-rRNA processing of protein [Papiliotrema laurentii]|uniref:20S pre-rRNA processing of protein n=1 Tax=Papiliotrema laurentii TaxID=5418 RepID=A0AAD9FWY3_PAPLA|nr:putative 20S pre-rRNA processing of protein [Papiliotrema laurentii]